jgi:hypothetical protein
MRLLGFLLKHSVIILIDSGSSHNFLDQSLLLKVPLPLDPSPMLQVHIADGTSIQCFGLASSVSLRVQGHNIITNFYVISLGGCDVVLGVEWLRTLGPILWDFTLMTMQFTLLNQSTTLTGIVPRELLVAAGTNFLQSSPASTKGLLLKLLSCDSAPSIAAIPDSVQTLLDSFAAVFTTSTGLPPARSHDHSIVLTDP